MEPGREGTLSSADDHDVVVSFDGEESTVTRSVAETISVTADPSPPPRAALPEQIVLGKDRYGR
jgi:DtxR family Mn-dependent transcriptional regulator